MSVAKIQQNLPELKRDGNTVLGAVSAQQLYDDSSTQRAGSVMEQMDFIPKIAKQLQESPDDVIAKLEKIRQCSTFVHYFMARPHELRVVRLSLPSHRPEGRAVLGSRECDGFGEASKHLEQTLRKRTEGGLAFGCASSVRYAERAREEPVEKGVISC